MSNVPNGVIGKIGEYLACPQRELGKVLLERFGFQELENATSDDFYECFNKLAHVKDHVHLLKAVGYSVFSKNYRHNMNVNLFIRFLDKYHRRNILCNPIYPKITEDEQLFLGTKLIEVGDFDYFMEYMIIYPTTAKGAFNNLNYQVGKAIIERIMSNTRKDRFLIE